jgi:hypothetical protein
VLYLRDPALVRRVLLDDGWHRVDEAGLRVTDRGVSWAPPDRPAYLPAGVEIRVYAARADVLAVEEWAPERPAGTDRVDALEFPAADRPPPADPQPIAGDLALPLLRDLRRTLRRT